MKYKIIQVIKEHDDRKPLTGTIQLGDAYLGGVDEVEKEVAVLRIKSLL